MGARVTRRFVIDMNLSPDWRTHLPGVGWPAGHWSSVGSPRAKDVEVIQWCRENDWM